jgi:hypothetical protein
MRHRSHELVSGDYHWNKSKPRSPIISEVDAFRGIGPPHA